MVKVPHGPQSTLGDIYHLDEGLRRLHQRARETGCEVADDGLCAGCDAMLTETDIENGACTQCDTPLMMRGDDE